MTRILTEQAVADGDWNNGIRADHVAGDAAQQVQCLDECPVPLLACDGGGDGTGLGFGASITSPEATATNENHPSMLTQLSWTSPYTNRLLLEANAQFGPYFWWGSRQKNAYDTTMIPVQETAGAYSEYQLPRSARELVRAHWVDEHLPGGRLVHYRVALDEGRFPLSP